MSEEKKRNRSDGEVVLRAEGIHKTFLQPGGGELHILRGTDIEVRRGEIVSIVGTSGVGKTTLLHILGLLEPAEQGGIWIDGQEMASMSEGRKAALRNRTIGFVFQFYHLLKDLDARENVLLPAMVRRGVWSYITERRELRNKARALLRDVGLADRAHHRASQLSGGERQRVAIARALMNEPAVVLCDEPTGNLDVDTGREIIDLLWRLRDEQDRTYIVVTHDETIANRADRKLRLTGGVLKQV